MATKIDPKASKETSNEVETTVKDLKVEFREDAVLTLPITNGVPMKYAEARLWLTRMEQEEETIVSVFYPFVCSPLDGLVAFQRVLKERYGFTQSVPQPGMWGPTPPLLLPVSTSVDQTEQVIFGQFRIPGIEGDLVTMVEQNPPQFILSGSVKKKYKPQIEELSKLIANKLKEDSIYKGKAVHVDFSWDRPDEHGRRKNYDPMNHGPKFMKLDPDLENTLIFGNKVDHALINGLFTPIEFSDALRENGVPLRRGVLLAGPYGTGKTLTAYVTATKAERNGWTFIYLSDVRDLKRGLEFAAQYAPAVLFAEDVDRAVTGPRDSEIDEILNTLDGINTKNGEIITVFTTNHVDQINHAMLRPGRIDVFVEVTPPDAEAAVRLVKLYARGLMEPGADFVEIGRRLNGKIPAIIREVVERAKIQAIYRLKGGQIQGLVTCQDVLAAVDAMENHNDLIFGDNNISVDRIPEILVRIPRKSKHGRALLKTFMKGTTRGAKVAE